jgi:hypothetical protein
MLRLIIARLLLNSATAFRALPSPALRARVAVRGSNAEEEANIGRTFRVFGVNYKEGAYANLKANSN